MKLRAAFAILSFLFTCNPVVAQTPLNLDEALTKSVSKSFDLRIAKVDFETLWHQIESRPLRREDNRSILLATLQQVHSMSAAASRFNIDGEGRVSVNLSQVKASGAPVSSVILELRRWMEAYLAYCRRHIDPQNVDAVVAKVINGIQRGSNCISI